MIEILYSDDEHDFCYMLGLEARIQHYSDGITEFPGILKLLYPREQCSFLNKRGTGYRIHSIPEYDKIRNKKLVKLLFGNIK